MQDELDYWWTSGYEDLADLYEVQLYPGTITVKPAELTVTTGSASKTYDGTALTNSEASLSGLATGEIAEVSATGTITDAGTQSNTYAIEWGETNPSNETITENLGTLRVDPTPITVTARSESKEYDGSLLPENTDAPVIDGTLYEYIYAEHSDATITDAGEVTRECTIVWGEANPDNYDVTMVPGHLTITKRPLTVKSKDDSKEYDGEPLTCHEYEVVGLLGDETISVDFTGSQTEIGSSHNTFNVKWGTAKENNYTLTMVPGTLTVTKPTSSSAGILGTARKRMSAANAIDPSSEENAESVDMENQDIAERPPEENGAMEERDDSDSLADNPGSGEYEKTTELPAEPTGLDKGCGNSSG